MPSARSPLSYRESGLLCMWTGIMYGRDNGDWGLGSGVWGLGTGDWGLGTMDWGLDSRDWKLESRDLYILHVVT